VSDASGRLVFREGALVRAMRAGHWLVLDELNLAPSDVLEALNRCVLKPKGAGSACPYYLALPIPGL
jgi:midasin (ATPase involved in ribosome maturation)